MVTEVERKLNKYTELKKMKLRELELISENKTLCLNFIDKSIEKINDIKPKYIEGYELKIANERIKPIEIKENKEIEDSELNDFIYIDKKKENIKTDIILKNSKEEIIIGEIDCDVTCREIYGKRYYIRINYIFLEDKYQNRGYGTHILTHIPPIMSYLYRGEIAKVETTPEVIKYDKYKIHEITYIKRIKKISEWLIDNGYEPSGREEKESGLELYEVDLNNNPNRMAAMIELQKLLIKILELPFLNEDIRREYIKDCKNKIDLLCKNKYSDGVLKTKLEMLNKIKNNFNDRYNQLKKEIEEIIKLIDEVKILHNRSVSEDLEINEHDSLDDIAIKLYCKYFNFKTVGKELEKIGHVSKKNNGEKRIYNHMEIKELIFNSNTEYKELKKYAMGVIKLNSNS